MQCKYEKTRDLWQNGLSKEFGKLAEIFPVKVHKGKNNISFVARNNIPVVCTVTYSRISVNMRPHKEEPIRFHITVGGNIIDYIGKVPTKTTNLTTFNIHINSVISTRGAKYAGWDIGNYYLEKPMG